MWGGVDVIEMKEKKGIKKGLVVALMVGFLVALLVAAKDSFYTVPPGHKGVVYSRIDDGIRDSILGEGLQFKLPFMEYVILIDMRTQKGQAEILVATRDLQIVSLTVAVNYHVDPDKVNIIYKELGVQYKTSVIVPAIEESVKAVAARFTAEELLTKREEVKEAIKENFTKRLARLNIFVDDYVVVEMRFSPDFEETLKARAEAMKAKE